MCVCGYVCVKEGRERTERRESAAECSSKPNTHMRYPWARRNSFLKTLGSRSQILLLEAKSGDRGAACSLTFCPSTYRVALFTFADRFRTATEYGHWLWKAPTTRASVEVRHATRICTHAQARAQRRQEVRRVQTFSKQSRTRSRVQTTYVGAPPLDNTIEPDFAGDSFRRRRCKELRHL